MATKQTTLFTGQGRVLLPNNFRAGSPVKFIHTHSFAATAGGALLSTDILELFTWPQFSRFGLFTMISASVGAINVDVGVMTGTPGDTVTARTLGALLIDDGAANTTLVSTLLQRNTVGKNGDSPLSIGLVAASDITAGSKTITFEAEFY